MKLALLLFALAFADCTSGPQPKPTPVPGQASCATACDRARDLHCSWAADTPGGVSCVQVCENAQSWDPWNLYCRTMAASCGVAEACEP